MKIWNYKSLINIFGCVDQDLGYLNEYNKLFIFLKIFKELPIVKIPLKIGYSLR